MSEMAAALNVSAEQISESICSMNPPMSLTDSSDSENDGNQIEIKSREPEIKLTDKIAIKDALHSLDSKDRILIFMRYFAGNTQTETAKKLNMTQVQVSRREKKILQLLKAKLT